MSEIITVHLDQKPIYDIVIEKDFSQLGTAFSRLNVTGRKICIVTDSNVGPLYAKAVQEVLETTGNQIFVYTFAAGEENKNLNTVQDLYEFLIENHFDRKDMLAALGGGVVGDLTGFTAATYLRGISFIQIPTSLLAQVDSSIGGKTGVDFRAYKNMVGAFHQQRVKAPHFLLQQAGGAFHPARFQRIGANQLRHILTVMSRRIFFRLHFIQGHLGAGIGRLPSGFTSRQAPAYYVNFHPGLPPVHSRILL